MYNVLLSSQKFTFQSNILGNISQLLQFKDFAVDRYMNKMYTLLITIKK